MPCGVTKAIPGDGTVVCDNSGTSSHTGLHSGIITITFRKITIASSRVYWLAADTVPARQNAIVRGTAY